MYWLYWNSRTWSSSDVIVHLYVKVTSSCEIASSRYQGPLEAYLKKKKKQNKKKNNSSQQEKKIHYSCESRTEKSVPQDHHLSSLGKKLEKEIHYSCEGRIEKSVPQDHRLSSLGKPRDAKRQSSGRIFLSYPPTHDRFLYSDTG